MRLVSMQKLMLGCALVIGGMTFGYADEPPAPTEPASPPAAAAPSDAQATAATTPADEAGDDEQAKKEDALQRDAFDRMAKQYRKVEQDGQTVYCRNEKVLGTRLPKTVCLTDAQLWARVRQQEEAREELRNRTSICAPPRSC